MKKSNDVQRTQQMLLDYMIFFDGEWQVPPAFYLVTQVKGKSPEDAIASNLAEIIHEARSSYPDIVDGLDDAHIEEALCTVRSEYWISRRQAVWQSTSNTTTL